MGLEVATAECGLYRHKIASACIPFRCCCLTSFRCPA